MKTGIITGIMILSTMQPMFPRDGNTDLSDLAVDPIAGASHLSGQIRPMPGRKTMCYIAGMKEEVRWLIGIGVILVGLVLNAQRVHGNRIDQLVNQVERLEDVLTEHRVEAARDFGEIKSSIEYLRTGDPPGER